MLACLAVDLIDPGGIDQVDVAVVKLAPLATLDGPGLAVKRAGAEALFTQQGVDQRRFADTDAAENRNVDMPVFEFVQHRLDLLVVLGQQRAYLLRHALITEQFAQALARQREMGVTGRFSRRAGRCRFA